MSWRRKMTFILCYAVEMLDKGRAQPTKLATVASLVATSRYLTTSNSKHNRNLHTPFLLINKHSIINIIEITKISILHQISNNTIGTLQPTDQ